MEGERPGILRVDLCTIIKETAGVIIDPSDILEIHRIPGEEWKDPTSYR